MKSPQEQIADDVLFPHEPEAILATVRELIAEHSITVQMLIEGMKYMAKLSDAGIRLDHVERAVTTDRRLINGWQEKERIG